MSHRQTKGRSTLGETRETMASGASRTDTMQMLLSVIAKPQPTTFAHGVRDRTTSKEFTTLGNQARPSGATPQGHARGEPKHGEALSSHNYIRTSSFHHSNGHASDKASFRCSQVGMSTPAPRPNPSGENIPARSPLPLF